MHPRAKAKTKEISKTVLELAANGLLMWYGLASPKSFGRQERLLGEFGDYTRWRIRQTIKRLKMQEMIQYDEEDVKSPIILTEKGLARLFKFKLRDLFKKKRKWDYFWRVVFFDIPESQKHIRKALRQELINAGFYPLQKSVLVCPFDCESLISDFCKMYRIFGNILFCVTPSLGSKEKEVRKFFFNKTR